MNYFRKKWKGKLVLITDFDDDEDYSGESIQSVREEIIGKVFKVREATTIGSYNWIILDATIEYEDEFGVTLRETELHVMEGWFIGV